jgi:hypothetical protein
VTYRRFACSAGDVLTVQLQSDSRLIRRTQVVRAYELDRQVGMIGVGPEDLDVLRVPLRPTRNGSCVVTFRVARTYVPARVEHGSTDTRALGIRFLSFSVSGRP